MRETIHKKWHIGTMPMLALCVIHFTSLIVMSYAPKDLSYLRFPSLIALMLVSGIFISQRAAMWRRVEPPRHQNEINGLVSLTGRWQILPKLAWTLGLVAAGLYLLDILLIDDSSPKVVEGVGIVSRMMSIVIAGILLAPHLRIWEGWRKGIEAVDLPEKAQDGQVSKVTHAGQSIEP